MADEDSNRTPAKRQIARLIGGAQLPMLVISEDRQIVFANDAMGQLLQRDPETLLGLECGRLLNHEDDADQALQTWLAIPANVNPRHITTIPDRLPAFTTSFESMDLLRTIIPIDGDEHGCYLVVFKRDQGERALWKDLNAIDIGHRRMVDSQKTHVGDGDLWFLYGESLESLRAVKQIEVASKGDHPFCVLGPAGSLQSRVASIIAFRRQKRVSASALRAPVIISIDSRLMDRELLAGMFEMATDDRSRRPYVVLEGIENLAADLVPHCLSEMNRHSEWHWIATSNQISLESVHSNHLEWKQLSKALAIQTIELPRLNSRIEDIETLIAVWIEQHSQSIGSDERRTWARSFVDALMAYSWPGDVSEFDDALRASFKASADGQLTDRHLPMSIRTFPSHVLQPKSIEPIDLDQVLEELEKTIVLRAVERNAQSKAAAARMLGISRARLLRRLQQWGLAAPSDASSAEEESIFREVEDQPPTSSAR